MNELKSCCFMVGHGSDVSLALVLGPCLSLRTDPQVLGLGLGFELQVLGLGLGLELQVLGLGLDTQVLGKFQGPRTCVKDLSLDNSSSSRSLFFISILKNWLKLNNNFFHSLSRSTQNIDSASIYSFWHLQCCSCKHQILGIKNIFLEIIYHCLEIVLPCSTCTIQFVSSQ